MKNATMARLPHILLVTAVCAATVMAGCTAHRIDVRQGNFFTAETVAKVKPGMTREQVKFLLGTPLLTDAFHADRWDYVYRNTVAGEVQESRKVTVFFADGKVARVVSDEQLVDKTTK
jgi:outer membrane protein assembly factor BamE